MQIGRVNEYVDLLLGGEISGDRTIYLGESNKTHMMKSHPDAYRKYGKDISMILATPDYVGQNPTDGSIEYVKEYIEDGEYVKVAVRLTKKGKFFARSIYILNPGRVLNFIAKGTLKKVRKG